MSRKDITKKQLDVCRNYTIDMRIESGKALFEIGGLKYLTPPKPRVQRKSKPALHSVESANQFNVFLASNLHVVTEELDTPEVTQMYVNMTQQAEQSCNLFSSKSRITSGLKMEASIKDCVDYHCNAKELSTIAKATLANQKRAVAFLDAKRSFKDKTGGQNILKEYDDQHLLHSFILFFAACSLRFMDVAGKTIEVLEANNEAKKLNGKSFAVDGKNLSKTQNEVCLIATLISFSLILL